MNFKKIPGKQLKQYGKVIQEEKPTISIITPYYNGGETIEETYNTVMNQTYPFFEWIIVNDGSTDEMSNQKIEELVKTDSRIVYYKKENGGPSIARDYGISKASKDTKYVFFLDADDQMDSTMIECLYWSLETHEDASFAYTAMMNFGDKEFLWEKYLTIEQEKEENLINIASLVRKEDLLEVGCFGIQEKAMYEDWNLWLKLIRAGKKPLRISAPLFWYRYSSSGEFSRANQNKKNAMKRIKETAKTVPDNIVEPIQYPRYGDHYATVKERNMVLPYYEKNKKKTILCIFPWMVVGGADFFNLELLKRFPKEDYRFIVLTTTPNRNPLRQDFEEYAEVYDMSSFLDRIDYLKFTDYIMESRKVDFVMVSNTEYGYYMIPYLKSKYPKVPFIDYIHSVDMSDERSSFGRCTKDVDSYLYRTYSCNHFTQKQLEEKFDKKNVKTIYIGTDEEKFSKENYNKKELKEKYHIPEGKKVISFIARLSEEKRPEMFMRIANEIHKKDSNTFFVVAGDGPYMSKVKSYAEDHFAILGMIENTEEIYSISDVTVNCSALEGLALTSYESLAMEVPVISTDVGGQTELIDDSVGGIVHYHENPTKEEYEKEIKEYADKTIKVLKKLNELSKNCREKVCKGYTLNLMTKQFVKIVEESIEKEKTQKERETSYTIYELACEDFNTLYFNYTNAYYETNLGVYLTAKKLLHPRLYRHLRQRLERIGAVHEGKNIIEFLRSLKKLLQELKRCMVWFLKAIFSGIILVFKLIRKILIKPFQK